MADFAFLAHNVYRHAIVQLLSWQWELPSLLEYLITLVVCHQYSCIMSVEYLCFYCISVSMSSD